MYAVEMKNLLLPKHSCIQIERKVYKPLACKKSPPEAGKRGSARNINWRSNKTRTDTGDGSCEIMYVTSVKLDTNIYR